MAGLAAIWAVDSPWAWAWADIRVVDTVVAERVTVEEVEFAFFNFFMIIL
jgi:hypothetical protein